MRSSPLLILLFNLAASFPLSGHQVQRSCSLASSSSGVVEASTPFIESYSYKDWKLTYRYKDNPSSSSSTSPLVLIHPVGIGLNSWFWEKAMQDWDQSPVYAPDLIGCGTQNGGDAWDPATKPLSFPLGWAQGVEAMLPLLNKKCTLVCQGGLAPVAVLLAARNPQLVERLILASPPTWDDMTTAVPAKELERNYWFLTNPWTSTPAFSLLESKWALRFFSNAFLFSEPCDEEWISRAHEAATAGDLRQPVAAFNAGLCNHRSFQEELETMICQPTLILSGEGDKRDRQGYVDNMPNCQWAQLPGTCNVLPWEDPEGFNRAVQEFCES